MSRMGTVKVVASALRLSVGFTEAACCTVEVSEDGVDRLDGDVGWETFPGTVGDSCDHGCP